MTPADPPSPQVPSSLSAVMAVYPPHFSLEAVIRPNILSLQPYRCARDDYSEGILLDANENAYGPAVSSLPPSTQELTQINLHRYPDPSHPLIKKRIADLRGLPGEDYVFLGVGSDEVIDMLMRVAVVPGGSQKILTTPPTYGMYSVCAQVNDVGVVKVPLRLTGEGGEGGERGRFSVDVDEVKKAVSADPGIRLIFLCSPGNPTGTLIPISTIRDLLEYKPFTGIVVVDEAYIDFTGDVDANSAASLIKQYANVCVMQTLSKGFGLAAIRIGIALAQPPLIQILSNTKAPYNISSPTAAIALSALDPDSISKMQETARTIVAERQRLIDGLKELGTSGLGVGSVIGGNDANFVVVPILGRSGSAKEGLPDTERAFKLYKELAEKHGVVMRFRGKEPGCDGCVRITVGTPEENKEVLKEVASVLREI